MGADKHERQRREGTHWKPSRDAKRNRPPIDESWIWLTSKMIASPAWRAMRPAARKVLDRLILEHLYQAGRENGNLICTYNDFERFGIRRASVASAIDELVKLAWIDVIETGGMSYAEIRRPSIYALAWLDRKDGTPPTNRWKKIQTLAEAKVVAAKSMKRKPGAKSSKPETQTRSAPATKARSAPDTKARPKPPNRRARKRNRYIDLGKGGRVGRAAPEGDETSAETDTGPGTDKGSATPKTKTNKIVRKRLG